MAHGVICLETSKRVFFCSLFMTMRAVAQHYNGDISSDWALLCWVTVFFRWLLGWIIVCWQ